jgi:hypothetical protein
MNDKIKVRERRKAARKFKVVCPCGRVGCEIGRGPGGRVPVTVLRRREVRRGGLMD